MTREALTRLARLTTRGVQATAFLRTHPRSAIESFLLEHILRRPILYDDRDGLCYILRPGENAAAYLRARGNYEVAETAFCRRYLKPGMIAFDVGAHIGLYTLLFGRLVGESGAVYAFEPDAENAQRLRVNVLLNELGSVEVVEAAVAARKGSTTLHRFADGLSAWHSLGRPQMADPQNPRRTIAPDTAVEVAAVTLDNFCEEHGVRSIDLLKVDAEGAELDVLEGAATLLARKAVSAIQFEVSIPQVESLGHQPRAVFDLLRGFGFDCCDLDVAGRPAASLTQPSAAYRNYVAIQSA